MHCNDRLNRPENLPERPGVHPWGCSGSTSGVLTPSPGWGPHGTRLTGRVFDKFDVQCLAFDAWAMTHFKSIGGETRNEEGF